MGRPKPRTVLALDALAALAAGADREALSMEHVGVAVATEAATFDLDSIGQVVP